MNEITYCECKGENKWSAEGFGLRPETREALKVEFWGTWTFERLEEKEDSADKTEKEH